MHESPGNIIHSREIDLILKGKWFYDIFSGIKKEEYRELKEHYDKIFSCAFCGFEPRCTCGAGKGRGLLGIKYKGSNIFVSPSTVIIRFFHGYKKDRPWFRIKCTGLHIGPGLTDWGAEKDKLYYVLGLGEIIEKGGYFENEKI